MKSLRSRRHRTLCSVLVKARKAAGLSQHQLARRLKTSQTAIARFEIGERRLDVIELLDLTNAVGIDPHKVIDELRK